MLRSSPKPSFSYKYNCAINAVSTYKVVRRAHMVRGIKQKSELFLSKQCWSPRYKVPVLSTCGECHREGLIFASFYNFKYIANNHDNNNRNKDTNNNKISGCINFHLLNFYFPVSFFLYEFSFC